eukprot:3631848-Pleurochrysis_carterae.AAC.1
MAQDLNGLQYGPQINVAWTLWTAGLTECMDAPDWAMRFDDQIYSFDKKSAYLLMCKSAHGVQTAETLRDYMANIDLQVDARSAADGRAQSLQWLDKINKQFLGRYAKAHKEYKLRHLNTYQEKVDTGLNAFLEIFGGCRDLSME